MGDQNLRVWPVQGDGYGEQIDYPRYAKYRMEPNYPGASGPRNTDLVVYEKNVQQEENELGRHKLSEVMVAFAGQGSPIPQGSDPALQGDRARNTKGAAPAGHVDPTEHLEGSKVEHVHEGDGSGPTEHVDNYDTLDDETLREELTWRELDTDGMTPGTTEEMVRLLREDDLIRLQDPPAPAGDNPHNL